MAMVNQMLNLSGTVKDSRWLTLEVCREFQRSKCSRTENECKFAHPPPHVEVQNGRVTACFDSIKGKCQRKEPPCKYLHPPQHLKEQLLQNGRNNLILKNLQMQAVQQAAIQPIVPGMVPAVIEDGYGSEQYFSAARRPNFPGTNAAAMSPPLFYNGATMMSTHPYLGTVPTSVGFNPYTCMTGVPTMNLPSATDSAQSTAPMHGVMPASAVHAGQQKVTRPDRLEVCREFQRGTCTRQPSECRFAHPPDNVMLDSSDNSVTVCMDYLKGRCSRDSCRYFHPPQHLQAQIKQQQQRSNLSAVHAQTMSSIPGMVPYAKRMAVADTKSGIPMYQPGAAIPSYQQALAAMQLQQPPYVPITFAGHPPSMQRF